MKLVVSVLALLVANGCHCTPLANESPIAVRRVANGGRIVGGVPATEGQAPFQISLVMSGWFGDSHICGGSLAGKQSAITAAHCTDGSSAGDLKVKYGGLDRTKLSVSQTVKEIRQHESYNKPVQFDNDYSVLILNQPIQTTDKIKTIELVDSEPTDGLEAHLTGWGNTIGGSSSAPVGLQFAIFQILRPGSCQARYEESYPGQIEVSANMICAENPAASGCNGDSGGPLVVNGKLAGIVSWGIRNCPADTTKTPTAYANVAAGRTWLLSKIQ
ncbi:trypsin alpha-3-like [Oppia nitens]|uniref:trypsin alpha-3-like n=1 Tax=Oppia nitens TaxID=1686743 RepID=UPI0023DA16DC|nr:trypsin alpha-3-like [Oppia nitens]